VTVPPLLCLFISCLLRSMPSEVKLLVEERKLRESSYMSLRKLARRRMSGAPCDDRSRRSFQLHGLDDDCLQCPIDARQVSVPLLKNAHPLRDRGRQAHRHRRKNRKLPRCLQIIITEENSHPTPSPNQWPQNNPPSSASTPSPSTASEFYGDGSEWHGIKQVFFIRCGVGFRGR
jgi:hypothetical protein